MKQVDSSKRSTRALWWIGPLAVLLVAFIEPLGGTLVGAIFTGYLASKKAPRRDVIAMAVATVLALMLFIAGTVGVVDAYNDWRQLGPNDRDR